MCHIDSMPDEVIVRFFDGCTNLKELRSCALVSKRWFAVAQDHPIFWSCAQVSARHTLNLFLRRINHRRGLPVKIKASVYGADHEWHAPAYKAIVENMHRITDLVVDTYDEERVLQALFAPAPILETFVLNGSEIMGEDWPRLTPAPHHFLGGDAPHLTSVELEDATWVCNAPEGVVFPSVLNVSFACHDAFDIPGHGLDGAPRWLLPPDTLDRLATVFPGMVSLKLSMSTTRIANASDDRVPFLHPFPAAPPSDETKKVLAQLKVLEATWCASGSPTLQHVPIASIAKVCIRTEYQDTDVALACVPEAAFAVYVGVERDYDGEYEGIVRVSTDSNAQQRTIIAPVAESLSLAVLGAIFVSQVQNLCLLSISDAAFECLLNCGVDDLPALWALRVQCGPSWLVGSRVMPTYRAVDEENDPVSCPALRVLMFEGVDEAEQDMSAPSLEGYLDLIDAERDSVILGLYGFVAAEELRDLTVPMFERVIVEETVPNEYWMTRAHRLFSLPE